MAVMTCYDKFSCRIGSLLEGPLTDAVWLVEEEKIKVHKCILAAHSEYFYDHFTSPQADNVIELKDAKVEVVRALLEYFYKGKYKFHENVETDILALDLAYKLKLKIDLEEDIIDHLVVNITLENFPQFFNWKTKWNHKNSKLDFSCDSFLKKNGEKFARSDSFSKLSTDSLLSLLDEQSFSATEIDIFRAAEMWADVNNPDEDTVKKIIKKFRLATISQEDLCDIVLKSKKIPITEIGETICSITKKDGFSTYFRHNQFIPVADTNVAEFPVTKVFKESVNDKNLIFGFNGSATHEAQSFIFMLDQSYRLNALQFLLDSSEGRIYKYCVEVSIDGEEWDRVIDHSIYQCRSHQFLRFDPRALRFIKIEGKLGTILQIISIEAMHTNKKCSLKNGIQVAYTNVVIESRGATVTGGLEHPMHCIDGDKDTYTLVRDDCPLTITLGQPYFLSLLEMEIEADENIYTIETLTDKKVWQPAGHRPKVTDRVVKRQFTPRIVLCFRIKVEKGRIRLYQFKSRHEQSLPKSNSSLKQ